VIGQLTVHQAKQIADAYLARRERWGEAGEDETTSLLVVLLNYGDHLTPVACIGGEWTGTKGDLPASTGIPLCPNRHPLTESRKQFRLGLVESLL